MIPPIRSLLFTTALTLLPFAPAAPTEGRGTAAPDFEALLKIDAHSHMFEDHPSFHALFRRLNIRTINICVNVGDRYLDRIHEIAFGLYDKHPELYPFVSTFDLGSRDDPAYARRVIAWLDQTLARGAVGVKIWKEIGLVIKRPDGSFILSDDPLWEPIFAHLTAKRIVLLAHLGEPLEAWQPLDKDSPHYSYFSRRKEYYFFGKPEYPSHAAIIAARDRIMEKYPALVVVGAHLGSLEYDVAEIARRFDRYPNFFVDVSARTRSLVRQPSDKVRAFFIQYQDRLLYGLDHGWQPYFGRQPPSETQRDAHLNLIEAYYREDYAYYAGTGEVSYQGRRVEALNLPRTVLEKFYHQNAERVFRLKEAWGRQPAGATRP